MTPDWTQPFQEFAGRHAIVAGVGKGSIGAAIAAALHSLGATVTVLDVKALAAEEIIEGPSQPGTSILCLQADLAREEERRGALNAAISRSGPPAYFVSTIGLDERISLPELTQACMRHLYEVNFLAPFWTGKDLLAPMREGDGGSMLLFSSHHADQITDPAMIGYGTAKAALNKGIAYLAAAAGSNNTPSNVIRVNGLCPGWVWTPNQSRRFSAKIDSVVARQSIPVPTSADHLVGVALSILSNRLSSCLTGAIVNADRGEQVRQ